MKAIGIEIESKSLQNISQQMMDEAQISVT